MLEPIGEQALQKAADSEAMSDQQLAAMLAMHEARSVDYFTSEVAKEQAEAIQYYYGRPFGDERAGRSQVVDRTVAIVVDNAVASILKPFVSSEDVVAFEPQGEEDTEQAEQATEFINYIFYNDNPGFILLHNWFKDALLTKLGIVKAWWEDTTTARREVMGGLDAGQLEQILADSNKPDIGLKIVEGPYEDEDCPGCYTVTVERQVADGRARIENVPPEEFLITPFARSIDEATYCAHRPLNITRSYLVEMGLDKDVVEALPAYAGSKFNEVRQQERYQDEQYGAPGTQHVPGDKSSDLISIIDEYIKVDFNGDGIAELRRVIRSNDIILMNEEVDDNPFALLCPAPMPHKVYGLSLADQVKDLQRISSVLWRQMLDNLYLSNNPRPMIPQGAERSDGSTMDDLFDDSPGAAIRTGNLPIEWATVPFVADKSFSMLEYAEQQQEARTGIGRQGQGLDTNALKKAGQTTATEIAMIESGKNARVEMIARIFAETGVTRLFRILLKMVVEHQPRERMIRLRNKWVAVDPRGWNADMDLKVSVGLGVGNKMDQMAQASTVLETMAHLQETPYANLIDAEKVYNAVKRQFNAAGIKNIDDFLVSPDDAAKQQQGPPPDPEMIKAQHDMQLAEQKHQFDQQKAAAELQQQQAESEAKLELMRQESATKLQLEQQKAQAEAELAQRQQEAEFALAQRKMEFEQELAKTQAENDHKVKLAQAQNISSYRPGGDLDK